MRYARGPTKTAVVEAVGRPRNCDARIVFILPGMMLCASLWAATFTFQIAPSAARRESEPYVDDQTLISTIPSLKGTTRRLYTCINPMFFPASGTIEFAPVATGEHQALANRLHCQQTTPQKLTCTDEKDELRKVEFDASVNEYFTLGSHTDFDAALSVFRAFRDGKVEYAKGKTQPWIKGLPLRSITREGRGYNVSFSNCGCSNTQFVEQRGDKFVVVRTRDGICV